MTTLTAAVALLGLVVLFDLVVTVGLVRRLRAHSDLLAGLADNAGLLAVGTPLPEFSARTADGAPVDRGWLPAPAAVAFLAVNCPHCQTNLPEFVAYVRGGGYPREAVLAVIAHGGDGPAADDMIATLASVATVVRDTAESRVGTAFSVRGYPTFYLVDADGRVSAGAHAVRALPNTVAGDAAAGATTAASSAAG